MTNGKKAIVWFILFFISLSFTIYVYTHDVFGQQEEEENNNLTKFNYNNLPNETKTFLQNNICKSYPDLELEWCEYKFDKPHNEIIIINNDTITTIGKKPFDIISKVVKVVDGDTIDLASGERVRLSIANTPERGQEGYALATQFTKNLCLGKDAKVDLDSGQKGGSYGRVIGLVYCNNDNLNERLIEGGYATVWIKYCKVTEFKELCN